jgi:hypothetical protein
VHALECETVEANKPHDAYCGTDVDSEKFSWNEHGKQYTKLRASNLLSKLPYSDHFTMRKIIRITSNRITGRESHRPLESIRKFDLIMDKLVKLPSISRLLWLAIEMYENDLI